MQRWMFSIITPVFSVTWTSEIILICWFMSVETDVMLNKINKIYIKKEKIYFAQHFCHSLESSSQHCCRSSHVCICSCMFLCFWLFCPADLRAAQWSLNPETAMAVSARPEGIFLAHYLAVGWLWPARRIPEGIACCCKMLWLCCCSGCHSLIHWLWIQQESPRPSHFHLHVWLSPPPSFHLLKTLHDKHKISHYDSSVETFYLQQSTDITQVSIFYHELLFSLQSTYTLRKNGTKAVPGAVPFYPKGIWTYWYFKGTY